MRREPPTILSSVNEKPTHISPYGPNMEKAANPSPASRTNIVRFLIESLRMNKAYKIFPIYSKNKDQLGQFKGYISPTPRISKPGVAGIKQTLSKVASNNMPIDTFDTSHTEQP